MDRSKLVDLYNEDVFDQVLSSPAAAEELLRFAQMQHCAENLEFLQKLHEYNRILKEMKSLLDIISNQHLSEVAIDQINISDSIMKKTQSSIQRTLDISLPQLTDLFAESHREVRQQIFGDIYPRFVRHQLSLVTTQALYQGKQDYQGLGDCFVISDGNHPDQVIISTSDRFIELSGYPRTEITNRNCRLLQGQGTDHEAVRRLRSNIDHGSEVVEVLLNFRKNGQPFWNLLFVAPLKGQDGNVEYFLGGQINISSVINNTTDLFRILALSTESGNNSPLSERKPGSDSPKDPHHSPSTHHHFGIKDLPKGFPKRSRSLFSSLKVGDNGAGKEYSLEDILLKKMQRQSIETQMEIFSAAYSKYIVVGASDHKVMYYASTLTANMPSNASPEEPTFSRTFTFGQPTSSSSSAASYKRHTHGYSSSTSTLDRDRERSTLEQNYNHTHSHSQGYTSNTVPNFSHPSHSRGTSEDMDATRRFIGYDVFTFLKELTHAADDDIRDLKKVVKSHLKKGHAASVSLDSVVEQGSAPSSATATTTPGGLSLNTSSSMLSGGVNGMGISSDGTYFGYSGEKESGAKVSKKVSGGGATTPGGHSRAGSGGKIRGGPEVQMRRVSTHWTPLKDVRGTANFVIVVIGDD